MNDGYQEQSFDGELRCRRAPIFGNRGAPQMKGPTVLEIGAESVLSIDG
jgi:hypothetical protein